MEHSRNIRSWNLSTFDFHTEPINKSMLLIKSFGVDKVSDRNDFSSSNSVFILLRLGSTLLQLPKTTEVTAFTQRACRIAQIGSMALRLICHWGLLSLNYQKWILLSDIYLQSLPDESKPNTWIHPSLTFARHPAIFAQLCQQQSLLLILCSL